MKVRNNFKKFLKVKIGPECISLWTVKISGIEISEFEGLVESVISWSNLNEIYKCNTFSEMAKNSLSIGEGPEYF